MAIHKKGQAHWEGDLKSGKRNRLDRERRAEPAALWF